MAGDFLSNTLNFFKGSSPKTTTDQAVEEITDTMMTHAGAKTEDQQEKSGNEGPKTSHDNAVDKFVNHMLDKAGVNEQKPKEPEKQSFQDILKDATQDGVISPEEMKNLSFALKSEELSKDEISDTDISNSPKQRSNNSDIKM